ncbi:hypothetical protein [Halofilum ochraceum]|uniref:hypothetical protein n=1 Tax=Halofilum ochraceum TaxID=1611323 RepID=UPI0008DACD53|nr:hypothetical protein [Halofilum ochraceum]
MKRLLFFPGHRILAYEWRAGAFRRIEAFEPDEEGREQFRQWLREAPRTPLQMLIDVIEEEFHIDHVPHVIGRERAHLYKRTARKHFRNSDYTYITCQGRERQGRRDDRVLVAGLTNPELLRVWLDILAEAQVPLKGIHSLPLVGEYLLPHLGAARSERVLVVSQQVPSTLRQSYYENGRLRFSRLVPGRYDGVAEYADFVHDELHQTLHFLENQRFRGHGRPVDTYVLADSDAHAALRERLASSAVVNCHLVSLTDLAASVGDRDEVSGPYADTIFAQLLLSRRRPANHYGLARLRHFFFVQRARVGLWALAAGAVLAAVAVAGGAWVRGQAYESGIVQAQAREARFEQLYEERLSQLDEFDYRAVDVKTAVDLMTEVDTGARQTPKPLMDTLGDILAEHPALTLERLQWTRADGIAEEGGRSSGLNTSANGVAGMGPVVEIGGHVSGFDGDYRRAISRFEGFVQTLRNADLGTVAVARAPFDLAPGSGVSGDSGTTASKQTNQSGEFALELRLTADDGEPADG